MGMMSNRKYTGYEAGEGLVSVLFILYAFLRCWPYFLWENYQNGVFSTIGGVSTSIVFALLAITGGIAYILVTRATVIPKSKFLLSAAVVICMFLYYLVTDRHGRSLFNISWLHYLALAVFLLMPDRVIVRTLNNFTKLYVITLIPALIWYFLTNLLGMQIPYTPLESTHSGKVALGMSYKHYPGGCQIVSRWDPTMNYRFNGIYDEPGVIGTMSGLLLATRQFRFRDDQKRFSYISLILLMTGVVSFSLAFYVFVILFYISKNLTSGKFKGAVALTALLVAYIVFINMPIENQMFKLIQQRITITAAGLAGENRTTDVFDEVYDQFQHGEDLSVLLFGNGIGAADGRAFGAMTYKMIIYDYGYIGFALFVFWILCYAMYAYRRSRSSAGMIGTLTILVFANIYQRAGLFYFHYMMIFVGGLQLFVDQAGRKDRQDAVWTRAVCKRRRKRGVLCRN
ncbi:MAG: hypothetical protein HFI93_06380 [Lachnospiraceae bacterium]|nr:hypothetical protein [Lachnospiraceae bacterium]